MRPNESLIVQGIMPCKYWTLGVWKNYVRLLYGCKKNYVIALYPSQSAIMLFMRFACLTRLNQKMEGRVGGVVGRFARAKLGEELEKKR